jgi:hypothetical protein
MERQWANCTDCGWVGIVDVNVNACPSCGHMCSMNISLTEKERDDIIDRYKDRRFEVSRHFDSNWGKLS